MHDRVTNALPTEFTVYQEYTDPLLRALNVLPPILVYNPPRTTICEANDMPTILERFYETHQKSADLYASGKEVVAGGAAQSRVMYPHPFYVGRGDGAVEVGR